MFYMRPVGFSDKQMIMEKGRFVKVTEEKTAMAASKAEHTAHKVFDPNAEPVADN